MLNNHPIDNRILYASIKSYIYKFNIENDIPITYSLDNTLFSKVTDAVQMRFRNEDPAWTTFVNYSSTYPWILPPGYGNKVVYAEFMDSEGNYHQLSDDIFYIEMLTPVEDDDLKGFGRCVASSTDGNTAAVGAIYQDDRVPIMHSSAHVFSWTGAYWTRQDLTRPTECDAYDRFGYDIAISGDAEIIAVSAKDFCIIDQNTGECGWDNDGAVYIYSRQGGSWNKTKELYGIPNYEQQFGRSIALSRDGRILAVGAPGHNSKDGAIYVFYRNNANQWNPYAIIQNDQEKEELGFSVSISNLTSNDRYVVVAGAPMYSDDVFYIHKGAAYVYILPNIQDDAPPNPPYNIAATSRLTSVDISEEDQFGTDVSVSDEGDVIAVGTPYYDTGGVGIEHIGCIFVFRGDGSEWSDLQKIAVDDDDTMNDYFGRKVSLSGDGGTIIIGVPDDDIGTMNKKPDAGSAYVYTRQADGLYYMDQRYSAFDGSTGDQFGIDVAQSIDGTINFVGAHKRNLGTNIDQGSVYIFRR